jgi:Na+-driven multidrug efflux pump
MIKGWSMAFVMILMTYLLPAQFISMFMDSSASYLQIQNPVINDIVVFLLGFMITIGVISTEAYILKNYGHVLEYGVKKLMKLPKLLKK